MHKRTSPRTPGPTSMTVNDDDCASRLKYMDHELQDIEIMDIIGEGIELSENIKSLGQLGPKFRLNPKVDLLTMHVSIEKSKTKTRWEKNNEAKQGQNNKKSMTETPINWT